MNSSYKARNFWIASAAAGSGLGWLIANYRNMAAVEGLGPDNFYISHAMLYANRSLNIALMVLSFAFIALLLFRVDGCFGARDILWVLLPCALSMLFLIGTVSVSTEEDSQRHNMYATGALLGLLGTVALLAWKTKGMVLGKKPASHWFAGVAGAIGVAIGMVIFVGVLWQVDEDAYNRHAKKYILMFDVGENAAVLLFYASLYLVAFMRKKGLPEQFACPAATGSGL